MPDKLGQAMEGARFPKPAATLLVLGRLQSCTPLGVPECLQHFRAIGQIRFRLPRIMLRAIAQPLHQEFLLVAPALSYSQHSFNLSTSPSRNKVTGGGWHLPSARYGSIRDT